MAAASAVMPSDTSISEHPLKVLHSTSLDLSKQQTASGDKNEDSKTADEAAAVPYSKLLSTADTVDWLLMLLGTIGAAGNGLGWPIFAILFAEFSDAFGNPSVPADFSQQVRGIALKFVYLAIGTGIGSWLQAACWMWSGHRQATRLRTLYLQSVLRQDMAYFDTQVTTGDFLQGLNDDSAKIQAAISDKAAWFIQHMCTVISGLVVAFVAGWDMALVMVGTMPFMGGVGALLAHMTTLMSNKISNAYSTASSISKQNFSQVRTVAAYNGQQRAVAEYEASLAAPTKTLVLQSLATGLSLGVFNAILYWTYAVAFIYGAWRISTGDYDGGQVAQVFIAALLAGFSLGQAASVADVFAKGRTAGARLFKVIDRVPAIPIDDPQAKTLGQELKGSLEFSNVSFVYPARLDVPVLTGFNLVVPGGKTVALVGSSGSGKSTAVQLIERFYDPLQGSVLLDGVDIRTLNLRWLREQIALVSQEPTLFATSIYENIAMGRKGATADEVHAAAKAANAHNFISHLPAAYDTQVGERGLQMSGGQKQRIAIARAILKNPKILLLDEATSALDTQSERLVQAALDNASVGRTTVVVAHRLSTIRNADVIAVVKEGKVVEQGNHDELTRDAAGIYTTLVALQMQAEAVAEDEGQVEDEVLDVVETDSLAPAGSGAMGLRNGSVELTVRVGSQDIGDRKGSLSAVPAPTEQLILAHQKNQEVDKAKEKEGVPFTRLLMLNKPEWGYGLTGILGCCLTGPVQPAFALVLATFIVLLYDPSRDIMHRARFWCWMFFALGCAVLIGYIIQQYCFGKMGAELARRIRCQLFKNILNQEIAFFDKDENSSGALASKLSSDASYVRGAVGDAVAVLVQNLTCLVTGFAMAFVYDWRMALVVTGALPFILIGSILFYQSVSNTESGSSEQFAAANQAVSEAFSSIRVVQAYNLQGQVTDIYTRLSDEAGKRAERQSIISGALLGYSQFAIFGVYGLVIWFGGLEVESGRASFEDFLRAFLAILMACMGIAQAQIAFPDMGKAKGAIQSIFPLMDRKSAIDVTSTEGTKHDSGFKGAIQLTNVNFVYPNRPTVTIFKDFTLDIPAGQSVALVGESGSGKSTIVGLILRYYDVVSGTVSVDGVDVRRYNLSWLRSHIGLVSQEPLLFNCSVLDNIRYGKPDASIDEVEAAARAANAYDFISALPESFNTQVGEQGVQLSGGQKQRVAIARAVLKSPRILLLDEATSALDATSEKVVQDALDTIMVGRTSVVVAHRLSTIRNADKIAFVHKGVILEQGSHNELMALTDGGYARLVEAQGGFKDTPNGKAPQLRSSRKDMLASPTK